MGGFWAVGGSEDVLIGLQANHCFDYCRCSLAHAPAKWQADEASCGTEPSADCAAVATQHEQAHHVTLCQFSVARNLTFNLSQLFVSPLLPIFPACFTFIAITCILSSPICLGVSFPSKCYHIFTGGSDAGSSKTHPSYLTHCSQS